MASRPELSEALEPLVTACIERARRAWPGLALSDDELVAAIVERLPPEDAEAALAQLHVEDVLLACACATGDVTAIARFDQQCRGVIDAAIASTGATPSERADLAQVVRQRLLVPAAEGGPPRIASYTGRGALVAWVRVVATREAIRAVPKRARELAAEDDEIARMIAPDDDPEIGYLKRLYRDEFKRAFEAAVDALDDRDRLLLRQHVLDRLSIDQLAAQHAVHRATAARWVEAAREAVMTGTQRELLQRLRLSRDELASVIRLIRSGLDVSLPRVLGTKPS